MKSYAVLALAVMAALAEPARSQETSITVRVIANDAKIIGSGVGGARVHIEDTETGEILAQGEQQGETGATRAIMVEPHVRGASILNTPGAAHFTATLRLERPTVVTVVAEGPLGYEHAMQRASTTLLLVPGEDVVGDGIVLSLHGFIVELLEPATTPVGDRAAVRVRIRMLCGCPFTPGGLWDADRLTVSAQVRADGRLIREAPLTYAGERNIFAGSISLADLPTGAALSVIAADAGRANFGKSQEMPLP